MKSGGVAVWFLQCSDHLDLVGTSRGGLDHPEEIHGIDGSGGEKELESSTSNLLYPGDAATFVPRSNGIISFLYAIFCA